MTNSEPNQESSSDPVASFIGVLIFIAICAAAIYWTYRVWNPPDPPYADLFRDCQASDPGAYWVGAYAADAYNQERRQLLTSYCGAEEQTFNVESPTGLVDYVVCPTYDRWISTGDSTAYGMCIDYYRTSGDPLTTRYE